MRWKRERNEMRWKRERNEMRWKRDINLKFVFYYKNGIKMKRRNIIVRFHRVFQKKDGAKMIY